MQPLSPPQQLAQMLTSYWISQALHVAAKLGLADLVKDGPKTADNLAAATQTHPRSLYRLLRALASNGVFAEDADQRFSLTPLAECLLSDVPGSQRAMAIMAGEMFYGTWGELLYSVQTGKVAFEKLHGLPIFDFLSKNTDLAKLFDETMVSVHGRETAAMLEAFDFSGIRVLADIGGGNSSVLTAVLRACPEVRGILFDLPGVADRAKANLRAAGLELRCQVVGGSFFDTVPAGADAYLMRHIIHDWDDAKSLQILRNIHRAMGQSGRLLIVESVIPPGNDPAFGKWLDLAMMVLPGGQERTEDEYRKLFEAAGFVLTRIVATKAEVSMLEGRPAR